MNKKDLIAKIKEQGYDSAGEVYADLMLVIREAIVAGEEVVLDGIGKLVPTQSSARDGRNPKTGEAIKISAKKGVKLKVGSPMKKMLNG